MDINLRWDNRNSYSLAALAPLLPGAHMVKGPREGIMVYSFASRQKQVVFDEVSRASGDAVFIAGGPHPTGAADETLQYFDYVVLGEGEETLPELIGTIVSGGDISTVAGIAYKDESGHTVRSSPRAPVNLDKYPCFDPAIAMAPMEISRGCPFRCKYCQTPRIFGNTLRHRSISTIVSWARYYRDMRFTSSNALAYGSDGIHPRFDLVEKLLSELSKFKDKKIYFGTFPSEVRPDFITDISIDLIARYCSNTKLNLGVQSGCDEVLKRIQRGHTVEDSYNAIELCLDRGITPVVDFIVGFPGETEEEQDKSLDMIEWICKKGGTVHAHHFEALPGTPYEHASPAPVSQRFRYVMGKLAKEKKVTGTWGRET